MLSVAAARQMVLQATPLLSDPEKILLSQARNRVLRETIYADTDHPPFTRSAMDGFAVAEPATATGFRLRGTIAAGTLAGGALLPGQADRIFTGAPVPLGATRVVPQEEVKLEGENVHVATQLRDLYWRVQGEDFRAGDEIITAPRLLRPVELSILASLGQTEVRVSRRPRVIHVSLGDELVAPEAKPVGSQIRDSNSVLVQALLEASGAERIAHRRVGDQPGAASKVIRGLSESVDLLLISGGASVGAFDFAAETLLELGYQVRFRSVNLRPGKPLIFATRGEQVAFALPGNPVSHFVTFHLFVRSVIAQMLGLDPELAWRHAPLAVDFCEPANARETYSPARWSFSESGSEIAPIAWNSSGHLACLLAVNALWQVPAGTKSLGKGELTSFLDVSL